MFIYHLQRIDHGFILKFVYLPFNTISSFWNLSALIDNLLIQFLFNVKGILLALDCDHGREIGILPTFQVGNRPRRKPAISILLLGALPPLRIRRRASPSRSTFLLESIACSCRRKCNTAPGETYISQIFS